MSGSCVCVAKVVWLGVKECHLSVWWCVWRGVCVLGIEIGGRVLERD